MSSSLYDFTEDLKFALEPTFAERKAEAFNTPLLKAHDDANFSREEIRQMFEKNKPDAAALEKYSKMTAVQMWEDAAEKLSFMMFHTCEFCSQIPGFGQYYHYAEHVRTITACFYDLIILRLSRAINVETDEVLYGRDMVLPMNLVGRCSESDPGVVELVNRTFEMAKKVAALNLTDLELALFKTIVITWPEREGLEDLVLLPQLHVVVLEIVELELVKNHAPVEKEVFKKMMDLLPELRDMGPLHLQALRRFEEAHPDYRFPNTVYQEVFCNKELYKGLYPGA